MGAAARTLAGVVPRVDFVDVLSAGLERGENASTSARVHFAPGGHRARPWPADWVVAATPANIGDITEHTNGQKAQPRFPFDNLVKNHRNLAQFSNSNVI